MERIAIIGMGLSGSAVLTSYSKFINNNNKDQYQIDCYDSQSSFGRGLPFREDSDLVLLNTRSKDIGYDFEDLGDFGHWLSHHYYQGASVPDFSTRPLFGRYLRENVLKLTEDLSANVIYHTIHSIDWNSDSNTWILTTDEGIKTEYNRIHLCCGTLPPHDPYNLNHCPNYISSPYPLSDLPNRMGQVNNAIVIGTNLTAIDVIKYLSQAMNVESIYAFSRQNNFPAVGLKNPPQLKLEKLNLDNVKAIIKHNYNQLTFKDLDELIEYEMKVHQIDFEKVNTMVSLTGTSGLRESFEESELVAKMEQIATVTTRILVHLWQYMPESERELYEEKYHKAFTLTKGKIPLLSAEAIIDAEDKGQLTIFDGVSDIFYDEDAQNFVMVNSKQEEIGRAEWVVNATGLKDNLKLETVNHPLLEDLLNKRYIASDTAGGISINATNMTVISPSWGEFTNLHAHGTLISGAVYLTNSTFTIQSLAHKLVARLFNE